MFSSTLDSGGRKIVIVEVYCKLQLNLQVLMITQDEFNCWARTVTLQSIKVNEYNCFSCCSSKLLGPRRLKDRIDAEKMAR